MTLHERYDLSEVINAKGTFTPLGVSRSSAQVCQAVAGALANYFVIDELQDAASRAISQMTGAEAGAVTHCVASGITVAIAAAMAGTSADHIAALPDTADLPDRVVLPAGHAINYGHSILQAVRLCGATPVLAGSDENCTTDDIERAIDPAKTCCVLLVSSRLVKGNSENLSAAVDVAHRHGIPVIIDGAAQDMRIGELLKTGADLVLVSGQKYLASPTAGLALGRRSLVQAIRAQETGIGRAMKPTKEAIIGVLAAIDERNRLNLSEWRILQDRKVSEFVQRAGELNGVSARSVPDPCGMPFNRAHLHIDGESARLDASTLATELRSGTPSIWVMDHKVSEDEIIFELVQTEDDEIQMILTRLSDLVT